VLRRRRTGPACGSRDDGRESEQPPVPPQLWIAVALASAEGCCSAGAFWHYEVRATTRGTFFAALTIMALGWTRVRGSLAGTFTKGRAVATHEQVHGGVVVRARRRRHTRRS